ncbi:M48 family metallopeptidase [Pseudoalteromonas mariniglutinosa]|uniref:M48 family metallopeptidase n=1 Tax=Pseudoalteromonas mariniglutinosa TaxID=206042 RepID=UPI003850B2DF
MDYTLKRSKRRKTVAVKIAQQQLTVYAPHYVSQQHIHEWLLSKESWINAQLNKQSQQAETRQFPMRSGNCKLFAETLVINFIKDTKTQWQQDPSTGALTLSLSARVKNKQGNYQHLLESFLHSQLESYIEMRVSDYCQQMGEALPALIRIQIYKRRWGSCNRKRELTFNLHLASAPTWVIDYVIVHELAHLKYLNHSMQFWHHVAKFYPEYKKASDWLKDQGASLQWVFE